MQKSTNLWPLAVLLIGTASPAQSVEADGKALLEERCGRCHAVSAGVKSPLGDAPNSIGRT